MSGWRRPGAWRRRARADPQTAVPVDTWSEGRLAALCLAALLVSGGALGSLNLLIGGVLRDGAARAVYGVTMLVLVALGVALAALRRVPPATPAALVLVGDAVYVVIARSVTDPLSYAPPLMLLFCCATAAWFLGPRMLAVHMGVVVVACALALSGSDLPTAPLVVQVTVSAAVLDVVTVGVFLQRRRVQRLLASTLTLSSTDPLTGLSNRRFLVEQAPRVWRQAHRDGQRVAALVLDLDHFKRLNDAFGHSAGDAVLRAVARALSSTVRPADVLARTGGEELVVLGLVSDSDEARHLAERLRQAVAATGASVGLAGGGPHCPVTVSIGVALTRPGFGEEPTDALWKLIDRADAAMYLAKQHGRDQVVLAGTARVPAPRPAGGAPHRHT